MGWKVEVEFNSEHWWEGKRMKFYESCVGHDIWCRDRMSHAHRADWLAESGEEANSGPIPGLETVTAKPWRDKTFPFSWRPYWPFTCHVGRERTQTLFLLKSFLSLSLCYVFLLIPISYRKIKALRKTRKLSSVRADTEHQLFPPPTCPPTIYSLLTLKDEVFFHEHVYSVFNITYHFIFM